MEKERITRDKIDLTDIDLLKPIDVLSFGSEDDPCFGKLHDLKAPECQECGDAEFCAIVKGQNLQKERIEIETNKRFKDIEESDKDMIEKKESAKETIKWYKEKGYKRMKTVLLVAKGLNLSKDIVKQIYDKTY